MKPPIFNKLDGGKIEPSVSVILRLFQFRQNTPCKKEAGGVLIGRYIQNSFNIVIDDITVPMRGDCRKRYSFFRAQRRHQQAIDQVWRNSAGTSHYLGEWHTHPEPIPEPSDIDLKNWQRHLQQDVFNGDTLYFVIVGTKRLRVWEGNRLSLNFEWIGEADFTGVNIKRHW